MLLEESFWYEDPHGERWEAPERHVVDGASIPRVLWHVVGDPFGPEYRNASVVHDVYCDWGNWGDARARAWRDTHRMFYNACRCGGLGEAKAKLMYAAVYKFGPKWEQGQSSALRDLRVPPPASEAYSSDAGSPQHEDGPLLKGRSSGAVGDIREQERFLAAVETDLLRNPAISLDEIEDVAGPPLLSDS